MSDIDFSAGREVSVTYRFDLVVFSGETLQEAVLAYINSVAWALDNPTDMTYGYESPNA